MNYIFIDVHSPNVRGNHEVHQVIQSLAPGTSPPRLQQHRGSTTPEAELQPGRGWNPLDPMGSTMQQKLRSPAAWPCEACATY